MICNCCIKLLLGKFITTRIVTSRQLIFLSSVVHYTMALSLITCLHKWKYVIFLWRSSEMFENIHYLAIFYQCLLSIYQLASLDHVSLTTDSQEIPDLWRLACNKNPVVLSYQQSIYQTDKMSTLFI